MKKRTLTTLRNTAQPKIYKSKAMYKSPIDDVLCTEKNSI